MAKITKDTRNEVKDIVLDFFAEECEIDPDEITEDSNIISDLDGDSLMFLELIEIFKKKYNLNIELKTIGKFSVKNPVKTIGELIDMQLLIIEHENNILNIQ
jgi:acyl carrier protein